MKNITVSVQNDQDAEMLRMLIESAQFKQPVEIYEESDEYTAEDLAEWDKRMAELEKDPSKGRSVDEFMKEMKAKYGV